MSEQSRPPPADPQWTIPADSPGHSPAACPPAYGALPHQPPPPQQPPLPTSAPPGSYPPAPDQSGAQFYPHTRSYPPGQPVSAAPASGMPYSPMPYGPRPAPAPGTASGPVRVEAVPGTEFGVAYLRVPPTVSGLAVGSLVSGIASIVVAFIIGCVAFAGFTNDSLPILAGAFAVLATLLAFAGAGLGYAATRQIRTSRGQFTGRAVGISGMVCGGVGLLFTSGGVLLALVLIAA